MSEEGAAVDASAREIALSCVVLFVATFALQANGLDAWFVGDDFDFLVMIGRLDGALDVLAFSFWGEWEPLWHLSWYVDQRLWQLDAWGYHLTNTLWFAACVVGLFLLVRSLWPEARAAAWTAGLLFLVHPLHDEAVVYLAARGHPMALGLALPALGAWVRASRLGRSPRRAVWITAALAAAFFAGLAKESALTLPAWVAALEALRHRERGRGALVAAFRGAAWFALPVLAVFVCRAMAVGLGSDKLTAAFGAPLDVALAFWEDLPEYALLVGLPLPFGFVDHAVVQTWRPLGWLVILAVLAGFVLVLRRDVVARGPLSRPTVLQGIGLVVAALGLFPVLWADLSLRRRYGFVPSAGFALLAVGWLELLWLRRPRSTVALVAALVLAGAAGTVWRNALWVRSGEVARSLYDEARRLPPAARGVEDAVVLVTLPRSYGGDFLSGVYLLHRTDLVSLLRLAGVRQREAQYALATYHAHDYTARVAPATDGGWALDVGFRGEAAFRAAAERDAASDREGDLVAARRIATDPANRRLRYRLALRPPFEARRWLLYSEGRFEPIDLSLARAE